MSETGEEGRGVPSRLVLLFFGSPKNYDTTLSIPPAFCMLNSLPLNVEFFIFFFVMALGEGRLIAPFQKNRFHAFKDFMEKFELVHDGRGCRERAVLPLNGCDSSPFRFLFVESRTPFRKTIRCMTSEGNFLEKEQPISWRLEILDLLSKHHQQNTHFHNELYCEYTMK